MDLPKRKNMRLKEYDYSETGRYFVTVCTYRRQNIFEIDSVGNTQCGVPSIQNQIIYKWINITENKFKNIKFDKYIIMPDHLHFIVNITERHIGRSLQDVMNFFKTMTTNDYINCVKNDALKPFNKKLWQKSYYDHIIRNQDDYNEIWEYIDNNPIKWYLTHNKN